MAQRILKEAGYRLDLVTLVDFVKHEHPRLGEFYVPNRLWRGKLPHYFATVLIDDVNNSQRIFRYDLRRRSQRRRLYERVIRQGDAEELRDWIDGALLIDLWDELRSSTGDPGSVATRCHARLEGANGATVVGRQMPVVSRRTTHWLRLRFSSAA